MQTNTAIFYDIENLIGPFTGRANTILHLDEIYRRVLAAEGVSGVSIQRAYADWVLPLHRNLRGSVLQVGIEPVQIFNTNPHDKIKNAADVALIIDAVELIAKRPEIDTYVIATGDGIFAFLAKKLHEHGKRVIGIGFDGIVNMIFRNSCDMYIGLSKTDKSIIGGTVARMKKESGAEDAPTPMTSPAPVVAKPAPAAKPAAQKTPAKFPKTKYSEILTNTDLPIWRDLADASGALMAVRGLLEALHTDATKELPDLEISIFMTYLRHYVPGFTSKRFNYPHFSNFMRFMLTGSPLTVYADENSHKIGRRGEIGEKGEALADVVGLQFVTPDGTRYASIFDVPQGSSFVHTITKPAPKSAEVKPAAPKAVAPKPAPKSTNSKSSEPKPRTVKPVSKPRKAQAEPKDEPAIAPIVMDEGSIRKWIKNQFDELSRGDVLASAEARRLTSEEYSTKTFGVRAPIFREITTRSNLTEQRTHNGKVKYWKETFKFNGKYYIIFKEWAANMHAERFGVWLAKVKK